MRAQQLREMEKNIMQIRHALEQAEQDKDKFVEEKLEILLKGDWHKGKRHGKKQRE